MNFPRSGPYTNGYSPDLSSNRLYENIVQMLMYEHNFFTEANLNLLKNTIGGNSYEEMSYAPQVLHNIEDLCQKILFLRLKNRLDEGYNAQINQDKEAVFEKITNLNFPPELNTILDKIDEYYWDTKKNEFDWSMAISKIREFWDVLTKHMVEKIESKTGDSYKKYDGKFMAKKRKLIANYLRIGDGKSKEDLILDGLIDIVNKEGAHNLISEREYFRLSKNMSIELSLLLLTKLEKFLEK